MPASWPVVVLNVAHDGLFWIWKVKGSLSASVAEGAKVYAALAVISVIGAPLIVGARFALAG